LTSIANGGSVNRRYLSGTNLQLIFPLTISSQATLAGEPWFGRVTQPGFKNKTPPRFSFRGTWV